MKNLSIKDAYAEDREAFETIKKNTKSKASKDVLKILIQTYNSKASTGLPNTDFDPQNAITLLTEQGYYIAPVDEVNRLQEKVNQLNQEIETLTENQNTTIKLTGTQLIYEPSADLAKKIMRVGYYLIKEGKLKRTDPDLPQQVITKLVNYGIKNEYSDILK